MGVKKNRYKLAKLPNFGTGITRGTDKFWYQSPNKAPKPQLMKGEKKQKELFI
jgi:hypothetical protein